MGNGELEMGHFANKKSRKEKIIALIHSPFTIYHSPHKNGIFL